jgi:hypothetical protein
MLSLKHSLTFSLASFGWRLIHCVIAIAFRFPLSSCAYHLLCSLTMGVCIFLLLFYSLPSFILHQLIAPVRFQNRS